MTLAGSGGGTPISTPELVLFLLAFAGVVIFIAYKYFSK
jgi:hypothetical protein